MLRPYVSAGAAERQAELLHPLAIHSTSGWMLMLALVRLLGRTWSPPAAVGTQEFDECIKQIDKVLEETEGLCEYAIYVKALIMRHRGVTRGRVAVGTHSRHPQQHLRAPRAACCPRLWPS